MRKVVIFILFFFAANLFADEVDFSNDTTRIRREMVAPTEYAEAMEAYNIGTGLYMQNYFAQAEPYLLKAIEIDEYFVDAMDHLGLVYRNLGRFEDAEYWYLKSIEINPNNTVPYINLAVVYRFQGRLEDARQVYIQANRVAPDNPEPNFGIGMVYQEAGYHEISIDYIDVAMRIYYERESMLLFNAFFAQGNNYYSLEDYEEALRLYKLALIGHPDNDFILGRINEIEERFTDS